MTAARPLPPPVDRPTLPCAPTPLAVVYAQVADTIPAPPPRDTEEMPALDEVTIFDGKAMCELWRRAEEDEPEPLAFTAGVLDLETASGGFPGSLCR